mgnify:CR=1 FL=1
MKLLIVDDELQIRMGLAEEINWKEMGITDVLTSKNGVEAIELCEKFKPEIVITDIHMPGIDGLELSRQVSKLYEPIEIIILSGFSEFDYAKKAIQYGVNAYLLKPIEIDELVDVVKSSIQSVQTYYDLSKNRKVYNHFNRVNRLKKMLAKGEVFTAQELKEFKKTAELDHFEQVVAGTFVVDDVARDNNNQLGIYLQSILDDFFKEISHRILYWDETKLLFLMSFRSAVGYERSKRQLIDQLENINIIVKSQLNNSLSLTLSALGEIHRIPSLFNECYQAVDHRLYLGVQQVIFTEFVESNKKILVSPLNTAELKRIIEIFEYKEIHNYLLKVFNDVRELKVTSTDFVRSLCSNIRIILIETLSEKGIEIEEYITDCPCLFERIPAYVSIDQYFDWVDNLYFLMVGKLDQLSGRQLSRAIVQAIDYIENHYNEEINLKLIALHTGRSKNYLCSLFKKEMGISFVEYLNKIRVEQAKRKLRNTDEMIFEIAASVGYSDYKYFSTVFKKYTDLSPQEYRKNHEKS